jgi:hypothetical protein
VELEGEFQRYYPKAGKAASDLTGASDPQSAGLDPTDIKAQAKQ